jgi:hypothetical protein
MLGSLSFITSTIGTNILTPLCSSATRYLRSLSISITMGSPLPAHSVLMTNEIRFLVNCPCTKGSANASIAQAA